MLTGPKNHTKFPFWRLRFGKESAVRHPSNGEGLTDIQHSMSMFSYLIHYDTLLQNATDFVKNATAILLQNVTEVYYKMRQVFYYKMQQF